MENTQQIELDSNLIDKVRTSNPDFSDKTNTDITNYILSNYIARQSEQQEIKTKLDSIRKSVKKASSSLTFLDQAL